MDTSSNAIARNENHVDELASYRSNDKQADEDASKVPVVDANSNDTLEASASRCDGGNDDNAVPSPPEQNPKKLSATEEPSSTKNRAERSSHGHGRMDGSLIDKLMFRKNRAARQTPKMASKNKKKREIGESDGDHHDHHVKTNGSSIQKLNFRSRSLGRRVSETASNRTRIKERSIGQGINNPCERNDEYQGKTDESTIDKLRFRSRSARHVSETTRNRTSRKERDIRQGNDSPNEPSHDDLGRNDGSSIDKLRFRSRSESHVPETDSNHATANECGTIGQGYDLHQTMRTIDKVRFRTRASRYDSTTSNNNTAWNDPCNGESHEDQDQREIIDESASGGAIAGSIAACSEDTRPAAATAAEVETEAEAEAGVCDGSGRDVVMATTGAAVSVDDNYRMAPGAFHVSGDDSSLTNVDDFPLDHGDYQQDWVAPLEGELVDEEADNRSIRAEVERRISALSRNSIDEAQVIAVEPLSSVEKKKTLSQEFQCTRNCVLFLVLLVIVVIAVVAGVLASKSEEVERSESGETAGTRSTPDATTLAPSMMPPMPSTVDPIPPSAFETTEELYNAVDSYIEQNNSVPAALASLYGRSIGSWNVSLISDFSGLFDTYRNPASENFTADLSKWDVSRGTDFFAMFFGASSFESDLSRWDVSLATSTRSMFNRASSFNSDLSNWNVSRVRDLGGMFAEARAFNGNISAWNVSGASRMAYMFDQALSFNADLSAWNTEKCTDMSYMFRRTVAFNGQLSNWDVSRVRNMYAMFESALFNTTVSSWNVSRVENLAFMFNKAPSFNDDLSRWDVSSCRDMKGMFQWTSSWNGNVSSWDVSHTTDMSFMFAMAKSFNRDLSAWNVSNVLRMVDMFEGAYLFNYDLSSWDISSVSDMRGMFKFANAFNQNLCSWGNQLNASELVGGMFSGTGCPNESDPILSKLIRGPLCYECTLEF